MVMRFSRTGRPAVISVSLLALFLPLGAASAQEVDRGTSALDLPRPGYEPRRMRFGTTTIAPELRVQSVYESNVFATSANEDDDIIVSIAPRIDATSEFGDVRLKSDIHADHREYTDNGRESRTTFGLGTKGDYGLNRAHRLTFGARFDRDVESRADPEATRNPNLPPRKIDMLSGELGYSYKLNRIGIGAQGGVQRQNYLAPDESDRDLTTWRGSVRVSAQLAAGRDVFLLGFVNRRDHRLSVDRSGLDRDATTLGFLTGAGLDIGTKWRGEIGIGLFRTNSDDPTLRSFSGFAANGKITWSPDERTAITADVFRGDVATVQSGAGGRIDTRIGLRLDQEIRHNLLMSVRGGVRRTSYRGGAADQRETTASVGGEVEYLMNRHISIFVNANYAQRYARIDLEDFKRTGAGVGLRLRY
ncbi:hypothetical protein BSL82_03085 [Tardibacter chloracetimidivorans]|uniref:Outer membrane protein beta-barrel domain-containing protein n=1 Tax=Tardibacter chloracetimidivorans TaxID=1921510 RepID=A0A1L3ZS27_9SPHN|nr:outer membrane beta-barrel protein [Tardibacter chloracetimidivorans]API58410.1 hypothetical protein BSL82_03085 [Tardibacter chloracetimidivorans]